MNSFNSAMGGDSLSMKRPMGTTSRVSQWPCGPCLKLRLENDLCVCPRSTTVRNHPEGPGMGMGEKGDGDERRVENAACLTGDRASISPTALAISWFVLRRNLGLFRRGLVPPLPPSSWFNWDSGSWPNGTATFFTRAVVICWYKS